MSDLMTAQPHVWLNSLSLLVHAYSKVGKSTLAGTAPPPLLIMDAEGSTKFLPLRMQGWDPHKYAPPVYDGTWDAVVVKVRSVEDLRAVYNYLNVYPHPFRSVVLDSVSEVQRKMKVALTGGTGDMNRDLWGQILVQMDALVRGFRDLQDHPTCPVQVVVVVAETRLDKDSGMLKPYVQGQLEVMIPYWFDVVGYLQAIPAVGGDGLPALNEYGMPILVRRLHTAPNMSWEAGERVQGRLGAWVDHPTIPAILEMAYPTTAGAVAPVPDNASNPNPTEGQTA